MLDYTILRFDRSTLNVSELYENYQRGKYILQAKSPMHGWLQTQKATLIDSIMHGYPTPPIFLRQHIDTETGNTTYEVVDGNSRIEAVVDFIEGKFPMEIPPFVNVTYGIMAAHEGYMASFLRYRFDLIVFDENVDDDTIREVITRYWKR